MSNTIAVKKLKTIAAEAMVAETESAKAALFCATRILGQDLKELELPGMSEHIERSQWSISAILGYADTNGHSRSQHLSWALGSLDILEHSLRHR